MRLSLSCRKGRRTLHRKSDSFHIPPGKTVKRHECPLFLLASNYLIRTFALMTVGLSDNPSFSRSRLEAFYLAHDWRTGWLCRLLKVKYRVSMDPFSHGNPMLSNVHNNFSYCSLSRPSKGIDNSIQVDWPRWR